MQSVLTIATLVTAAFAGVIPRDEDNGPVNIPVDSVGNPKGDTVQAITHLYICSDANFSGRCQNLESNTGQCFRLHLDDLGNGFNDVVSSLGPDAGTSCTIWENAGCTGASIVNIVNPGIYNLADSNWNFNDKSPGYASYPAPPIQNYGHSEADDR
ncbi:hypothetical protein CPAR01_00240 [Colletotrichum paranaense]|uniref:Uncharacterized protein n=1 Tax=Colletotrichum paranaense TaxID=1914294 RepID=A0ABQ9T3C5_9PEZI|nr:uncharacterized protein CPAR01_00240 [Colletotrichum paranaense]KAK1546273.1 hypothetical protein CPAR01_00240 [Colletotrichum paranaense]